MQVLFGLCSAGQRLADVYEWVNWQRDKALTLPGQFWLQLVVHVWRVDHGRIHCLIVRTLRGQERVVVIAVWTLLSRICSFHQDLASNAVVLEKREPLANAGADFKLVDREATAAEVDIFGDALINFALFGPNFNINGLLGLRCLTVANKLVVLLSELRRQSRLPLRLRLKLVIAEEDPDELV